jgi:antitoxin CcdA
MATNLHAPQAPKKSFNLSINSDLLRQAKDHHLNLSKGLEPRLIEMLREAKRYKGWKKTETRLQRIIAG